MGEICITGNKMDTKQATVNFNIFVQIRWAGKLVITIITRFLIICERLSRQESVIAENLN